MSAGDLGSLEWTVRARLDKLDADLKEGDAKVERFRARAERPLSLASASSGRELDYNIRQSLQSEERLGAQKSRSLNTQFAEQERAEKSLGAQKSRALNAEFAARERTVNRVDQNWESASFAEFKQREKATAKEIADREKVAARVDKNWESVSFSQFKSQERITKANEQIAQAREAQSKRARLEYRLSQVGRKEQAEILRGEAAALPEGSAESVALLTRANRVEQGGQAFGWFQRFVALEAVRIGAGVAAARATYAGSTILAGNDLSAQLKAQLQYRQDIMSAAPFGLGQLAVLAQDPGFYQQTSIQATQNLAEAQDKQIEQRQKSFDFYQSQSFKTLQETTPNRFVRRGQEIAQEENVTRPQEIERQRELDAAAIVDVKNKQKASIVAAAAALGTGITEDALADPTTEASVVALSGQSGTRDQVKRLYREYQSVQATYVEGVHKINKSAQTAIAGLPAAASVQTGINASQHQAVISAAFYAAQSNIFAGGGQRFRGALSDIQGQNAAEFFNAESPEDKARALVAGASRVYRLFGETGIELTKQSAAIESSAAVTTLRTGGSYLAANLTGIESERQRQLIEASQFAGAPGYGRLVSAINLNASAQGQQATVEESKRLYELTGSIASLTKQLQHDPLGARIAEIQHQFLAATAGLSPFSPEYINQTAKYGLQLGLAQQQFADVSQTSLQEIQGRTAVNQLRAQYKNRSAQALEIGNQYRQAARQAILSGHPELVPDILKEGQSAEAALKAQFSEENLGSVTGGYGLRFGPGFQGKRKFFEPPSSGIAAANAQSASLGAFGGLGPGQLGPPKPSSLQSSGGSLGYIEHLLQGLHDFFTRE